MNKSKILSFSQVCSAFYVYCDIIKQYGNCTENTPIGSFYVGCALLYSLACEIGLKALLSLENKPIGRHFLNDLFNNLSLEMQKHIITYTEYKQDVFNKKILDNKNHFVEWRYYYESEGPSSFDYDFMLRLFVAIKVILDQIKVKD